jgi:ankyrin repeat protein
LCKTSKKETALHWTVQSGKYDMVAVLMQYGADPFAQSVTGTTPMELAVSKRNKQIISIMMSKFHRLFNLHNRISCLCVFLFVQSKL